jgi:hypothetical protein
MTHISIRENIKASAKRGLGNSELKQHKPWFKKDTQNKRIEESRLNFNCCRTQAK